MSSRAFRLRSAFGPFAAAIAGSFFAAAHKAFPASRPERRACAWDSSSYALPSLRSMSASEAWALLRAWRLREAS